MSRWNVYTDAGDWLGIRAWDASGAARYVLQHTYGRARILSISRA